MAYRYLSPGFAPGTVPIQVVSAGSEWPGSFASGTTVPPLIFTATASTNGAQTRNVVVPSLCGVAPNESTARVISGAARKPERKSSRHFATRTARSFLGNNPANEGFDAATADFSCLSIR